MEVPLRILAVVPEPIDVAWAPIAAAAWASVEQSLRVQVDAGSIEIVRLRPATASALEAELRRAACDVVHVVSRGTSRPAARHGTVTLEGSDRRARHLNAQNFAKLCALVPELKLVILQTAGGPAAELDVLRDTVAQLATSVVCAPASVDAGPGDVVQFARSIYTGLVSGQAPDQAFAVATRHPSAPAGSANSGVGAARLPVADPPPTEPLPAMSIINRARRRRAAPDESEPSEKSGAAHPEIDRKRAACAFDVFLCHHVGDKAAVVDIGRRLMASGVLPWLDQWELRPGMPWQRLLEDQIANIRAAAVFVGREGIGPWQRNELDGFLREFNKRSCPVIPVMLPGAGAEPELPLFLRGMTWVDFRTVDPDPLAQLIWGITGERPHHTDTHSR